MVLLDTNGPDRWDSIAEASRKAEASK